MPRCLYFSAIHFSARFILQRCETPVKRFLKRLKYLICRDFETIERILKRYIFFSAPDLTTDEHRLTEINTH